MSVLSVPSRNLSSDPAYRPLKEFLIASTGLVYYAQRDEEFADRIASRLEHLEVSDCASYLELLERGDDAEAELDALTEQLTIGETYFFRHQEAFNALRDIVLPDLIRRNESRRRLRIWSAGCSIGAEAYSLSILLKRDLAELVRDWEITILGTDINRKYLATARNGQFEEWATRSTPAEIKRAFFMPREKSWCIKPEFQAGVSFEYHNLVKHPFPSLLHNLFAFDLILCRNVMIYFSPDINRRIIQQFEGCLTGGGWLLVGHAESNLEWYRSFRTVESDGAVLYQKVDPESVQPERMAPALTPKEIAVSRPAACSIRPAAYEPLPRPRQIACGNGQGRAPASAPRAVPSTIADIRMLADQGQLEAAQRGCEQLLKSDQLNPTVHFYQALIFEQMGRHQETEAALKRAIYLDRRHLAAHYYLGVILQQQGERGRADQSFRNLLALLSPLDHGRLVPDADELTVAELEDLTRAHLDELQPT
jgi:chemotaxis protein methyltransferase CheR